MAPRLLVVCVALMACSALARAQSGSAHRGGLAAVAGPDAHRRFDRDRAAARVARSRPPRVWAASNLGAGFGSIAVSRDRVFVQGMRNFQSVVSALNRADGKLVWVQPIGRAGDNYMGPGPRGTPTVDGDRLYVLTENGDLACLRAQDGTVVWQRNILQDFGGRNIGWLISESPLVDGDHVIVTPGGRGAGMAALDKMTGKTVWTARS